MPARRPVPTPIPMLKIRQRLLSALKTPSTREVVDATFRALQVPVPDEARAASLAEGLSVQPPSMSGLLPDLLRADEAAPELVRALVGLAPGALEDLPVVSLGSHCFTAEWMKRWRLRRWSGPLDWTFSSPAMVRHCIEDDFATFLDRGQYEPVPVDERPHGPTLNRVEHRLYRERFGIRYVFNHHDVHLDEDHAYLTRCVQRFRQALAGPRPPYLLMFTPYRPDWQAEAQALCDAIAARTPHFRLAVFVVHPQGGPSPVTALRLARGALRAWEVVPRSPWQPLAFVDRIDDLLVSTLVHDDLRAFATAG